MAEGIQKDLVGVGQGVHARAVVVLLSRPCIPSCATRTFPPMCGKRSSLIQFTAIPLIAQLKASESPIRLFRCETKIFIKALIKQEEKDKS